MKTNDGISILPIYVQHASPILAKNLSKEFSPSQPSIQAKYENGFYKIINYAALIGMGFDAPHEPLTVEAFTSFIQQVKIKSQTHFTLLCADANLGSPGDEKVSACFQRLVGMVKPTCLVPFSDTPLCVDAANAYLSGFKNNYQHCRASNKSAVKGNIRDLLEMPLLWTTPRRTPTTCSRFFGFSGCVGFLWRKPIITEELSYQNEDETRTTFSSW